MVEKSEASCIVVKAGKLVVCFWRNFDSLFGSVTVAVRGRRSYVLSDGASGGKIVVRIDKEKHRKFAEVCQAKKVSMNSVVNELIESFVSGDSESEREKEA